MIRSLGAVLLGLLAWPALAQYALLEDIADPAATAYTHENAGEGRHCYVATAYNTEGAESEPSNEACRVGDEVDLSWVAPTENEDGSPLTNLAGFRLYVRTEAVNPPQPPANLTATSNLTAYTLLQTRDNLAVLAVGQVESGTACLAEGVIADGRTLYVVPRDAVTFAGDVQPQAVYAECG